MILNKISPNRLSQLLVAFLVVFVFGCGEPSVSETNINQLAAAPPEKPPVVEEGPHAESSDPTPKHSDKKHTNTNRLADETSPYLLQHAGNPVDWLAQLPSEKILTAEIGATRLEDLYSLLTQYVQTGER